MSGIFPEHQPVLLKEFLSFFAGKSLRFFVDATIGAGGHAKSLLEEHPEIELFIGLDQDSRALEIAEKNLKAYKNRLSLIQGNFREIDSLVSLAEIDGIFLDIGVSSMQLDSPEKGFSFNKEGPLDMRMDPRASLSAEEVINTFSEKDLGYIFREYGEESRWRAVAKAIVRERKKKPLRTTFALCEALKTVVSRRRNMHPMTLIFQALRIYVNDELGALQESLPKAFHLLKTGGRLGVIAFHSLEDRIVKHYFRELALLKEISLLTKKPIVASAEEKRKNRRSRSAKMRFLEKRRCP